jgi:hypothetical protein
MVSCRHHSVTNNFRTRHKLGNLFLGTCDDWLTGVGKPLFDFSVHKVQISRERDLRESEYRVLDVRRVHRQIPYIARLECKAVLESGFENKELVGFEPPCDSRDVSGVAVLRVHEQHNSGGSYLSILV